MSETALTLALDTALEVCQAAVIGEGGVLGQSAAAAKGGAEAIVTHADSAMARAGIAPAALGRIAVTVGPGSFTGVRVGIAYAKGLALALGLRAIGVPTLEVLAEQAGMPCVAGIDARHGAVFAGLYRTPDTAPEILGRMSLEDCLNLAKTNRVPICGQAAAIAALGEGHVIEQLDLAALCRVSRREIGPREPSALYLAEVDAAPQAHKALARA